MTDDERDQLLSDVLDGVATDQEHALVEADPELRANLVAIAAAQEALRTPVPPVVDSIRESMISAALAELTPTTAADAAQVIDLAGQRARRQRRLNLLGAAAALVLVIGGAAIALRAGDDGSDADTAQISEAELDATADGSAGEAADDDALAARSEAVQAAEESEAESRALDLDAATAEAAPAPESAAAASNSAPAAPQSDEAESADDAPAPSQRVPLLPLELESCRAHLEAHAPGLVEIDAHFGDGTTATAVLFTESGEHHEVTIDITTCEIVEAPAAVPGPGPEAPDESSP
jgi:hypothetical protein